MNRPLRSREPRVASSEPRADSGQQVKCSGRIYATNHNGGRNSTLPWVTAKLPVTNFGRIISLGFFILVMSIPFVHAQDVTPPTVGITDPANNSYRTGTVTQIVGTATDDIAIDKVKLSIKQTSNGNYWDGVSWVVGSTEVYCTVYPSSWTYTNVPIFSNGRTYELSVSASDTSNNWSIGYATSTFTLDNTTPLSNVTSPVSASTIGSLTAISGTATDSVAVGTVQVAVREDPTLKYWNGTSAFNQTGITYLLATGTTNWSYTGLNTGNLVSGTTYYIRTRATDLAGNIQVTDNTIYFVYVTPPPPGTTLNADFAVNFDSSPIQVNLPWNPTVTDVSYSSTTYGYPALETATSDIVDRGETLLSSVTDYTNTGYEDNFIAISTGHVYTFKTTANKYVKFKVLSIPANNSSINFDYVYDYAVVSDITPPTVPGLLTPTSGYTTNQQTVSFDWSDATDTSGIERYVLEISTDPSLGLVVYSMVPTGSQQVNYVLAPGTYYWHVKAKDTAGNYSAFSEIWTFTVTAPVPLAVTNDCIPIKGLQSDGMGTAAWQFSHQIPSALIGGAVAYAYYNLASRDYVSTSTIHGLKGYTDVNHQVVGFTNFTTALTTYGKNIGQVTIKFGKVTLGADVQNSDWWVDGDIEHRIYFPVNASQKGILYVDGVPIIECNYIKLNLDLDYNIPTNYTDDTTSGLTAWCRPENITTAGDPQWAKDIATAFLTDVKNRGIRLKFNSIQPIIQEEFTFETYPGAYFSVQDGSLEINNDSNINAVSIHYSDSYQVQYNVFGASTASSVSVTGTGISNPISLDWDAQYTGWNSWKYGKNLTWPVNPPTPPLTYYFTIIEPSTTTYTTKYVNTWITSFATNLAPTGFVTSIPTFTWTGVAGKDKYSLELIDYLGTKVWTKLDIINQPVVYAGASLNTGTTYTYNVSVIDDSGNMSIAKETFCYQSSTPPPPPSVSKISGTITNSSGQTGTVYAILMDASNFQVKNVLSVSPTGYYEFTGLADGNYRISAIVDSNPAVNFGTARRGDPGEARKFYNNTLTILSSNTISNVDFTILPVPTGAISGQLNYSGIQRGTLIAFASAGGDYKWSWVVVSTPSVFPANYKVDFLADSSSYSVSAYLDLNGNETNDANEPSGSTSAIYVVSGGTETTGVNFTLTDPAVPPLAGTIEVWTVYTSSQTGNFMHEVWTNSGFSGSPASFKIGSGPGGPTFIPNLTPNTTYYVRAYIDKNYNYSLDSDEASGIAGGTAAPYYLTSGATVYVNITITDPTPATPVTGRIDVQAFYFGSQTGTKRVEIYPNSTFSGNPTGYQLLPVTSTEIASFESLTTNTSYYIRSFIDNNFDGQLQSNEASGIGIPSPIYLLPGTTVNSQVFLNDPAPASGKISGTITNNSGQTGTLWAATWVEGQDNGPEYVVQASSLTATTYSYEFTGLSDGKYSVATLVDSLPPAFTPDSRPDPGEAWGFYRNDLTSHTVTIANNSQVSGIDITITPVPTGGISGTINYTGTERADVKLYARSIGSSESRIPYSSSELTISTPSSFPIGFTLIGLTNAIDYQIEAGLDLNGNNDIDWYSEPKGSTEPVVVSGGLVTSGINLTLKESTEEAKVKVWKPQSSMYYEVRFELIGGQNILSVKVNGPDAYAQNLTYQGPNYYYGYIQKSTKPLVGDNYVFSITRMDSSSTTTTVQVTGVVDVFAQPTAPMGTITTTVPNFVWQSTAPVSNYGIEVREKYDPSNNQYGQFMWGRGGILPALTNINYNDDNKGIPLMSGKRYEWNTVVNDMYGNASQSNTLDFVPGGASTVGSVTGMVKKGDNSPITGAEIEAHRKDLMSGQYFFQTEVMTDNNGSYNLTGLPIGEYMVRCNPPVELGLSSKEQYGVYVTTWYPANVDFVLGTAGGISGTVTNSQGSPVSNAVVEAYEMVYDPNTYNYRYEYRSNVLTNSAGFYTLANLAVYKYYRVQVKPPANSGLAQSYSDWWWVTEGQTLSNVNFMLQSGGVITGSVRNNIGQNLPGVEIVVSERMYDGRYEYRGSAVTLPDGMYTISGLIPSVYRVEANPPITSPLSKQSFDGISVTAGMTMNLDFVLAPGGIINGTVNDYLGLPQVSAVVNVSGNGIDKSVYTTSAGTYNVSGLPPGSYQIECYSTSDPSLIRQSTNVYVNGGDIKTVDFTLKIGASVAGTVTNYTSPPVPLSYNTTGYLLTALPAGIPVTYDNLSQLQEVRLGSFSTPNFTISGVPIGTYDLYLAAIQQIYGTASEDDRSMTVVGARYGVTFSSGQTLSGQDFTLNYGSYTLNGNVRSEDGSPIFNPTGMPPMVIITDSTDKFVAYSPVRKMYEYDISSGRYEIYNLLPGSYKIMVAAGDLTPVLTSLNIPADMMNYIYQDYTLGKSTAAGSVSGTIAYSGVKTGQIKVELYRDGLPPSGYFITSTSISVPGTYLISPVPADNNYFALSFMDVNGNTYPDPNEPRAASMYPFSVYKDQTTSGINFTLTEPATGQTGMISGMVSYTGTQQGRIYVQAWAGTPYQGMPASSVPLPSFGQYLLSNITANFPFSITAFIDTNGNGYLDFDLNYKPTEPNGTFYTPVTVQSGQTMYDVNVVIMDPGIAGGAAISGTIYYNGVKKGKVGINVFANGFPPYGIPVSFVLLDSTGTFRIPNIAANNYYIQGFMDVDNNDFPSPNDPFGQLGPVSVTEGRDTSVSFTLEEPPVIEASLTNMYVTPPTITPNNDYNDDFASIRARYVTNVTSQTPQLQDAVTRFIVDINKDGTFAPLDTSRIIWDNYGDPMQQSKPHVKRKPDGTLDLPGTTWDWYYSLMLDQKKAAELSWQEYDKLVATSDLERTEWIYNYYLQYNSTNKTFYYDLTNLTWDGRNAAYNIVPNGTYPIKLQLDVPTWNETDGITYEYTNSTFTVTVRTGGMSGLVVWANSVEDENGNVLIIDTGPIVGAQVRVNPSWYSNAAHGYGSGVTDSKGWFYILGLSTGNYRVEVEAPGYPLQVREEVPFTDPDGINYAGMITLAAGGTVRGIIKTSFNSILSNAYITLYEKIGSEYQWRKSGYTDNTGTYSISDVSPGVYRVEATPPYSPDVFLTREVKDGIRVEGNKTAVVDFILSAGSQINGKVTDYLGLPVGSARIDVERKISVVGDAYEWVNLVYSITEGSYTVTGLSPGTYRLTCNPPTGMDYLKQTAVVDLTPGANITQNFTFNLGGTISGEVSNYVSSLTGLAAGTTGYIIYAFPSELVMTPDTLANISPIGMVYVGFNSNATAPKFNLRGLPTGNIDLYLTAGIYDYNTGSPNTISVVGTKFGIVSSTSGITTGANITAKVGTNRLSGEVRSSDGRNIFGADLVPKVILLDGTGKIAAYSEVFSNSAYEMGKGFYYIDNLSTGTYKAVVMAKNCLPATGVEVNINATAVTKDFVLLTSTETGAVVGNINYTGTKTGQVVIKLFKGGLPPAGRFVKDVKIASPGAYTITDVLVGADYTVSVYRDVNSNNLLDMDEPRGDYPGLFNVYKDYNSSGINVTLKDVSTTEFGSIKGKVNYTGTSYGRIYIQAWPGTVGQGTPVASIMLPGPNFYILNNIPANLGHSISAFLDTNGNGILDAGVTGAPIEPFGTFNTPVIVSAGQTVDGIDVNIIDVGLSGDATLSGSVYYTGQKSGKVYVDLFNTSNTGGYQQLPTISGGMVSSPIMGQKVATLILTSTGTFRFPNIAPGTYILNSYMDADNTGTPTKTDPTAQVGPITLEAAQDKTVTLTLEEPPVITVNLRNLSVQPAAITPNYDGTDDYAEIKMRYRTNVSSAYPDLQNAVVRVLVDTNKDNVFTVFDWNKIIWDNYGIPGAESKPHYNRINPDQSTWQWYNSLTFDQKKAAELTWEEMQQIQNSGDWFSDTYIYNYELTYDTGTKFWFKDPVSVRWEGRNSMWQVLPDGNYRVKIQVDSPYWDLSDGLNFEYAPTTFTVSILSTSLSGRVFTAVKKVELDGSETIVSSAPVSGAKVRVYPDMTVGYYTGTYTSGEGLTDIQGTFWVGGLSTGTFTVDIDALGYPLITLHQVAVTLPNAMNYIPAPVFLVAGGKIEGTVRTTTGLTVGNAYINVYEKMMSGTYEWRRSAVSETNGNYTVPDLQAGVYKIEVTPPYNLALMGMMREGLIVESGKIVRIDLVLNSGGAISGVVTDYIGLPVVSAKIDIERKVSPVEDIYNWINTVYSISEGSYNVSGLEPGTYRLAYNPPVGMDYLKQIAVIDVPSGSNVVRNISFSIGGTISGEISNYASLPSLTYGATGYMVYVFPSEIVWTPDSLAQVQPAGQVWAAKTYNLRGLPAGLMDVYVSVGSYDYYTQEPYSLSVIGAKYGVSSSTVGVTTGANVVGEISNGSLSGTVRSEDGRPIFAADAQPPFVVLLSTAGKITAYTRVWQNNPYDLSNGNYYIGNIVTGLHRAVVVAKNCLPIVGEEINVNNVAIAKDFVLPLSTETGSVAGTVNYTGSKSGNIKVQLFKGGLPPAGKFVKDVTITTVGAYTIPTVLVGADYVVSAYRDANNNNLLDWDEPRGDFATRFAVYKDKVTGNINVTLKDVSTTEFGTIRGRVLYTGMNVGRFYVQAWPGAVGQGNVVASVMMPGPGEYILNNIPANLAHSISVFMDTNGNGILDKDIEPFGAFNTPVVVPTGQTMYGVDVTVMDPGISGNSAISGTILYSGQKTGKVYVSLFTSLNTISGTATYYGSPASGGGMTNQQLVSYLTLDSTGTFRIPDIAEGNYTLEVFMDADNTGTRTRVDPAGQIGPIFITAGADKNVTVKLEEPPVINVSLRNVEVVPATITPNYDGTDDNANIKMQYRTSVSSTTPELQSAQVRVIIDTNKDNSFVLFDYNRIIWDNYGNPGLESKPHVKRKPDGTYDLAGTNWEWYNGLPIDQKKASEISWDELHKIESTGDWYRDWWVNTYELVYSTTSKVWRTDLSFIWEGRNNFGQVVPDGTYRIKILVDAPYWDESDGISYEYAPTTFTVSVKSTSLTGRVFTAVMRRELDGSETIVSSSPVLGVKAYVHPVISPDGSYIPGMNTPTYGGEGVTDNQGTFVVGGLSTGTYTVDIDALGYPVVHIPEVEVTVIDGTNYLPGPVFLVAGGKVEGIIRDTLGNVVPNAFINLYEKTMSGEYEWRRSGFTNTTGMYSIPDLQAANYRIEVIPPAELPLMRVVRDGIIIDTGKIFRVDLVLGTGASIVGTVTNYLGLPVVSGRIEVERKVADGKFEYLTTVFTITAGSYNVTGLAAPAQYRLVCLPPEGVDYIKQLVEVDLSANQKLVRNFVLSMGGTIRGKITNFANLPVLNPDTTGYGVLTFSANIPFSIETLKYAKPSGYGIVNSTGEYIVRGLPLETQDVYVIAGIGDLANGWFDSIKVVGTRFNVPSSDVRVSTGADVTVSVGAVTISGKVISGVGQPLFSPEEDPFMILLDPNTNKLAGWSRIWQTSDYDLAAGAYWIANLAPATRKVIIGARNHIPGTGEVVIGTTDLTRDFILLQTTATGTIAGTISYDGTQTGKLNLELFAGGLPPEGKSVNKLTLTATGNYSLVNIVPGPVYELLTYLDVNNDNLHNPGEPRAELRNLTVYPDKTTTANVKLVEPIAGQLVFGKVKGSVIYTGKAVGRIYVRAWPGAPYTVNAISTATIPSPGEYILDKIPGDLPHSYTAFMDVNNNKQLEKEVEPFGIFGKSVIVKGTETLTGVDIVIIDRMLGVTVSSSVINGTVKYNGFKSGKVGVSVFLNDLPPKGQLINLLTMESTGTFRVADLSPGNYFLFAFMDSGNTGEYSSKDPSGKIGPITIKPGEEKSISFLLEEPPVINASVRNITVSPKLISPDGDNKNDEATFTGRYVTNISSAFMNLQSASVRLVIDTNKNEEFEPFDWSKIIWDDYNATIKEMRPHYNRVSPSSSTWEWYDSLSLEDKKDAEINPDELAKLQAMYDWTREDWIDAKDVSYSTATRTWGKDLRTAWDGRDASGRIVPNDIYRAKVELDAPYWDPTDGVNFAYAPTTFTVSVITAGLTGEVKWVLHNTAGEVVDSGPVSGAKVFAGSASSYGESVTAEDGKFAINGLSTGLFTVTVQSPMYTTVSATVTISQLGDITALPKPIELNRGATVSGMVNLAGGYKPFTDTEGNFIDHIYGEVTAWNPKGSGNAWTEFEMLTGQTTAAYTIILPPGTFNIQAKMDKYISEILSVSVATVPVTGKDLNLVAPARIEGTVSLPEGVNNVDGVNVHITARDYDSDRGEYGTKFANTGTRILPGMTTAYYVLLVDPAVYKVSFGAVGYTQEEVDVPVTSLGQSVKTDYTLKAGASLVGKLILGDTSKIKLSELDVNETFPLIVYVWAPKTNYFAETTLEIAKSTETKTVAYEIQGLIRGEYLVSAELSGFEQTPNPAKVVITTQSANVPDISLTPYTGKIVGTISGFAVPEMIKVKIQELGSEEWQVRVVGIEPITGTSSGTFTIDGLGTGKYVVTIDEYYVYESSMSSTGAYSTVRTIVPLANGETKVLPDTVLAAGGVLTGKISLSSVRYTIKDLTDKYVIAKPLRMEWLGLSGDEFGKIDVWTSSASYRILGLAADTYAVLPPFDLDGDGKPDLAAKKQVTVVNASGETRLDFNLTDGHKIKGTVQRSITGTEKFIVQLVRREEVVAETLIEFVNTGVINNTTKLSLPFELGPVLSGKYQLHVWSVQANYADAFKEILIPDVGPEMSLEITLSPVVLIKRASIKGKLVDAKTGKPVSAKHGLRVVAEARPWVEGGWIETNATDEYRKINDETGEFRLAHLPAGTYVLKVENVPGFEPIAGQVVYAGTVLSGITVPDSTVDVDAGVIKLDAGLTIAGRITEKTNGTVADNNLPKPISNIRVYAIPSAGAAEGYIETVTDANGRYILSGLKAEVVVQQAFGTETKPLYWDIIAAERPDWKEGIVVEYRKEVKLNIDPTSSEEVNFELRPAKGILKGKVTVATGSSVKELKMPFPDMEDVPGAFIVLQDENEEHSDPLDGIHFVTQPDGNFEIHGLLTSSLLEPVKYTVKILTQGLVTKIINSVEIDDTTKIKELAAADTEIEQGAIVRGFIRDANQKRVSISEIIGVYAVPTEGGIPVFGLLYSNSASREIDSYEITGLPAGTYNLVLIVRGTAKSGGDDVFYGPEVTLATKEVLSKDIAYADYPPKFVVTSANFELFGNPMFFVQVYANEPLSETEAKEVIKIKEGKGQLQNFFIAEDRQDISAIYKVKYNKTTNIVEESSFTLTIAGHDVKGNEGAEDFVFDVGKRMDAFKQQAVNTVLGSNVKVGEGDSSGVYFPSGATSGAGDGKVSSTETIKCTITKQKQGGTSSGSLRFGAPSYGAVRLSKTNQPGTLVSDFYEMNVAGLVSGPLATLARGKVAKVTVQYNRTKATDPSMVKLYRYDETTKQWAEVTDGKTVDSTNGTVSANTGKFSTFAAFSVAAAPQQPVGYSGTFKTYSYPNPAKSPSVTSPINIKVAVPGTSTAKVAIKVYTVVGELVWDSGDKQVNCAGPGVDTANSIVVWDGNNKNGSPVASGVYIYTVTIDGTYKREQMSKLAIIR